MSYNPRNSRDKIATNTVDAEEIRGQAREATNRNVARALADAADWLDRESAEIQAADDAQNAAVQAEADAQVAADNQAVADAQAVTDAQAVVDEQAAVDARAEASQAEADAQAQ